jgi:5'-phosphate synthase pdxT subunit
VLCARDIDGLDQPSFGAVDVTTRRNAYGTQRESFEAALSIPSLGEDPFPGVFIRAPKFLRLGDGVESLCEYDGLSVLARAGAVFVCAFHPELTDDPRIHAALLGTGTNL